MLLCVPELVALPSVADADIPLTLFLFCATEVAVLKRGDASSSVGDVGGGGLSSITGCEFNGGRGGGAEG